MHRIALNIVSSLALIFTFTFVVVNTAQACSGGYPPGAFPLDYILDSSDSIIAIGRVSTTGESRINAVLTVDHYLREPQTEGVLLLMQNSLPVIYNSIVEGRPYPVRCSYLSPEIEGGRQFIASLYRVDNGTHHGIVLTSDENGMFNFQMQDQPEVTRTFTTEELIAYVENRLGGETVKPEQYIIPRPVSMRLFTQTGETYFLPVDQSLPMLIEYPAKYRCGRFGDDDCTVIVTAPNGLDTVSFYSIGSGVEEWNTIDDLYNPRLEGEAGVFSKNSDLFTAWTGNQIRVFATAGQDGFDMGSSDGLTLLSSFTASPDDPLITGAGAWSPSGRIFAFSTQSGVWIWDALTLDTQPVLLLSATDQPIRVRHYSPLGNYLGLEDGTRRYYLDMISGREYPDGLISPDDRKLVAYDTSVTGLTPYTHHILLPEFTPLGYDRAQISQFEWLAPDEYISAECGEPIYGFDLKQFERQWCMVLWISNKYDESQWVDGTSFDYDPITESLGVVVDGHTISINGEVIDLSGVLTDDIVRLELWPVIDLNYQLMDD